MLVEAVLPSGIFPGDIFRSGEVFLPLSSATLDVFVGPIKPITYDDLHQQLVPLLGQRFPIPWWVSALLGLQNSYAFTPLELVPTDFALRLGPTTTVTVKGLLNGKFLGFIDQSSGFSLSIDLLIVPSHDSSNSARVIRVASVNPVISVDAFFLGPADALVLAEFGGEMIAGKIEDLINEYIPTLASAAVARLSRRPNPTAVISCGRLTISAAGNISVVAVVADMNGPALVPLPQSMFIQVDPPWQCHVAKDYVVTVLDVMSQSPVPGAQVTLTTGDGVGGKLPFQEFTGTTDLQGKVEFMNVTLKSWTERDSFRLKDGGNGGGHTVPFVADPTIEVSVSGFDAFVGTMPCPHKA